MFSLSLQLADFGLSNHFQRGTLLQTYCGSPLYAAPEIVKGLPYQGPEVGQHTSIASFLMTLLKDGTESGDSFL